MWGKRGYILPPYTNLRFYPIQLFVQHFKTTIQLLPICTLHITRLDPHHNSFADFCSVYEVLPLKSMFFVTTPIQQKGWYYYTHTIILADLTHNNYLDDCVRRRFWAYLPKQSFGQTPYIFCTFLPTYKNCHVLATSYKFLTQCLMEKPMSSILMHWQQVLKNINFELSINMQFNNSRYEVRTIVRGDFSIFIRKTNMFSNIQIFTYFNYIIFFHLGELRNLRIKKHLTPRGSYWKFLFYLWIFNHVCSRS